MKLTRRGGKACVYLIRCEEYLKIGVAGYLAHRLMSLQVGNPFELTAVAYRKFDNASMADAAEALLHKQFASARHRGEWFVISDEAAIEALRAVTPDKLMEPPTVTIEWLPYRGAAGYTEDVPLESVQ
jgi:hypothetical protein